MKEEVTEIKRYRVVPCIPNLRPERWVGVVLGGVSLEGELSAGLAEI